MLAGCKRHEVVTIEKVAAVASAVCGQLARKALCNKV